MDIWLRLKRVSVDVLGQVGCHQLKYLTLILVVILKTLHTNSLPHILYLKGPPSWDFLSQQELRSSQSFVCRYL